MEKKAEMGKARAKKPPRRLTQAQKEISASEFKDRVLRGVIPLPPQIQLDCYKVVRFRHQGKPINGGTHATAEEAAQAQDKLRQELGYTDPGFFNFR